MRTGSDLIGRCATRGEPQRAATADKGAALVEMALTITLLVMLLVGVVTSAIALGRDNSIQNAAREASRFAATLPDAGSDAWFDSVIGVARSAATGDLDSSVPNQEICVAFITADDDATHVIDDGGTRIPSSGSDLNGCFTDGRSGEARVQVVNQRDATINAILFSADVTLEAEAAARYER